MNPKSWTKELERLKGFYYEVNNKRQIKNYNAI